MKNILLTCLIIIVILLLIAIYFWIRSFIIYAKDQTQKKKSIKYKFIALAILLCAGCVCIYAVFEKTEHDRKKREIADKIVDEFADGDLRSSQSPYLNIYKCPDCGQNAMRGRHSCNY